MRFFWFSIYDVAVFAVPFFIVSFLIVAVLSAILQKLLPKIGNLLIALIAAISFSCYIQGNFFLVNYGQLDGKTINWENYKVEGIISVLIWIFLLILCISLLIWLKKEKFFTLCKWLSSGITLIQIITIMTLMVTNNPFVIENVYTATDKEEYVYSEDENFVILLLDRFDSQVLLDILEEPDKDYNKILEDFTFYPNTVGMFPCTDLAIPHILSGIPYRNEETYGEYVSYAYAESPFLNLLDSQGYDIGIYSNITLPHEIPSDTVTSKIVNWDNGGVGVNSHRNLAKYIYKLVGFRYLPQPLKQYCWFYPDDIATNEKTVKANEADAYNWDNRYFMEHISDISNEGKKVFKLIHLDGTHEDFTLDRNLEEKKNVSTSITEEGRGVMLLVNEYLMKLKELNIYDNSVIIIMADHGHYGKQQSPLLLIKGKFETHDFHTDNKSVSYEDLQEAYSDLLEGKRSEDIFPQKAENARKYFFYKYKFNLEYNNYASDIIEYTTTGEAHDETMLLETGVIYKGMED